MSGADGTKSPLRCHHCGREVTATTHTRSDYRVDYYSLHTGDVEPTTMPRHDDPADLVTVMRLIHAVEIVTCVDCYRQPRVRREREVLFRSELQATPDPEVVP